MSDWTATKADNLHIEAGGTRYAYRRFGKGKGLPLLCLQHFTGTLDNWDPAIVDALAADREVILFENAGVGGSTGEVPDSITGMVDHVLRFVDALGLKKFHILGYSLGGFLAQNIAIARPQAVGRLILSGSAPEGGPGSGMDRPELLAIYTNEQMPASEKLTRLFFPDTAAGKAAADHFVARLASRSAGHDSPNGPTVASTQLKAMIDWANWKGSIQEKLQKIPHPVLVTNGSNDIMIPTDNSFLLAKWLPNATLIVYPNAGHGALFQYPREYVSHVKTFLGAD
jgi:pimeloyl-ACP methyl ester carboxylesterase